MNEGARDRVQVGYGPKYAGPATPGTRPRKSYREPCPSGKRRYNNQIEAMQALKRCKELGRFECAYYQCPFCGWWHLTSEGVQTLRIGTHYKVVDKGFETPCWIWIRSKNDGGYGKLKLKGKMMYAHRLSYMENRGPIPPGEQLDHLCRNRDCVNPWHLEPVTCAENLRRGLRTKLTVGDVSRIRQMYATGVWTHRSLAKEFGVSYQSIGAIVRGEYWKVSSQDPYTIGLTWMVSVGEG